MRGTAAAVSFFFQAEGGIRDPLVTGVQTCALPICSEPASAYQYAHGSRGGAAGVLGSAADGAVASRHADHGADELQAQRRAIRTAKDHFSIEGSVGDGTLVIPHRRGANAQTMCVFAVHGGARKHRSRPAAHHDLRRRSGTTPLTFRKLVRDSR